MWGRMRAGVLTWVAAAVLLAGGCTQPAPPEGPVALAQIHEGVEYYYACGNEVLHLPDGQTFYPMDSDDTAELDESRYTTGAMALLPGQVVAISAPGPGDDVGTLRVFEDGVAHWTSDSGITAWLDEGPREYDWIC